MSAIYASEPATTGKVRRGRRHGGEWRRRSDLAGQVLLVTSMGDLDIELWCKEAPLACRNFLQLCMEGYYDKTIFHRIVKARGRARRGGRG